MKLIDEIKMGIRIFKIAKKPTPEEFRRIAKVTGLSMTLIGVLGLVISVIFKLIG